VFLELYQVEGIHVTLPLPSKLFDDLVIAEAMGSSDRVSNPQ
jgi:hypothetical protein